MGCTGESGFGGAARTRGVGGPFACAPRREDLREQFSPGGYAGQVLTRIDLRGESAASLGGRRRGRALPPARLRLQAGLVAGRPGREDEGRGASASALARKKAAEWLGPGATPG